MKLTNLQLCTHDNAERININWQYLGTTLVALFFLEIERTILVAGRIFTNKRNQMKSVMLGALMVFPMN